MKPGIPFNRPYFPQKSWDYLREVEREGHLSGDGIFTQRCQKLLEGVLGVSKALLTTSCTHALEMAALLLDIQPADEVIVPSFTFVSTINSFVLRGARPVFVDIDPKTLNMDETRLESAVSPRTKAIIPVHYAGVGCEMGKILEIGRKFGIPVVEDNAHGLFGKYRNKFLGTFGQLSALSFHETKNFSCGEGGALLINHETYIERAEVLREKGTDRSKFFRGETDKYTWVDVGSSYLPSDVLAALLYAQLEEWEAVQQKRRSIWEYYLRHLKQWAADRNIGFPSIPQHCESSFHLFHLVLRSGEERAAFLDQLRNRGIHGIFHYLPLHLSKMGESFGWKRGDCPVTEEISARLVRLPLFNSISSEELSDVVAAVKAFKEK